MSDIYFLTFVRQSKHSDSLHVLESNEKGIDKVLPGALSEGNDLCSGTRAFSKDGFQSEKRGASKRTG